MDTETYINLEKGLTAIVLALFLLGLSTCSDVATASNHSGWGVHVSPDRQSIHESRHFTGTPLWDTRQECEDYMFSQESRQFAEDTLEANGLVLNNDYLFGCKPTVLNMGRGV